MKGLKLFGIALSIAAVSVAFASGWTVSVSTSKGILFGPSVSTTQTDVPFIINTFGPFNAPAAQFVNTLPQVNFLTTLGNPNPILVGDGTFFTGGTYTAAYTITSTKAPLTGFNFVVSGFVSGLGQIIWTKKVVDLGTSRVLYNGSGVFSGASYPGGGDGIVGISAFVPLAAPSANVQVIETFIVHIDGAPAPGTSTASLLLVEQDWVPEPASMLALSAGLAGLLLRRRAKK
ncbi:PEP-CTERM sorting domain-containing protein [Synechococcus sp. RC10A2]|uniref:PEP-CTERM sorting domain-containing protein n=1 Tax=Synechococcus sp. RC10A2 TaxID=2964529 RepID=UPI0039C66055